MGIMFATDLDRTVIFSNLFKEKFIGKEDELVCVEHIDGREISHMTKESYNLFKDLTNKENLTIIPVTTRSLAQFKRIEVTRDCEYAITTNGGVILHKGKKFKPWEIEITKIKEDYRDEYSKVLEVLDSLEAYYETEITKVDDIFYYVKVIEETKKIVYNIIGELIDNTLWNYTIQGKKLYVIPKKITKEKAVEYIKNYVDHTELITAGDGKLDKGLVEMGDSSIIPAGSELLNYIDAGYNPTIVESGLEGTIELLKIIKEK